jgi:subtilisin family serine protease/subtilisin-like proprotein convertase family protein
MRRVAGVFYSITLLFAGSGHSLRAAPPATGHFDFRMPHHVRYRVNAEEFSASTGKTAWLKAWPENGSTNFVQFGSRVVLQTKSAESLPDLLAGHNLALSRTVLSNVFILQAADPLAALREADRLARLPEVLAAYPVVKKSAALDGPYAPMPNDPYYDLQWYLEHRGTNGALNGPDLNVRAAWPYTSGAGTMIAVADVGVELAHPEFSNSVVGSPHFNFVMQITNGTPPLRTGEWAHGTECSGLMVAQVNNSIGMAGIACQAQLASWVIFDTNGNLAPDDQLMSMFEYQSNIVSVQNHSWGHDTVGQNMPTLLEEIGISNALTYGRSGRGVVMVRAAGNLRTDAVNADDDGYPNDPRVIGVGAVRIDGRVASFSNPGACLLVGAPSGDPAYTPNSSGLFTTDLLGTDGINTVSFFPPNQDLNNYVFNSLGFSGTSASAPQVAGVVALVLSVNPALTWRDVQQIILLSSRHFDFADPDLVTNGAGFLVSHNLGYGIPDAGAAVNLARRWVNRPPQVMLTFASNTVSPIPNNGLNLLVTGANLPAGLASIAAAPDVGLQADQPTLTVPLVNVGQATNTITNNLVGMAALIQRGAPSYASAITNAAQAGAVFAVVYNNSTGSSGCPGGDTLCPMAATDFVPIPAVFIGQTDGQNLVNFIATNNTARARIQLTAMNCAFDVTNTLVCEQVGVRLQTDYPLRGNLRVTLVSPMGTRSILQCFNTDTNAGPVDWTYYSTHHFFESSAGTWTLSVADEGIGTSGNVLSASLIIYGVPITDTDHDGLDDNWELKYFGTLAYGPKDNPSHDGYNNAFKQVLQSSPLVPENPFIVNLSLWNSSLARLSWPGSTNYTYQLWGGTNVASLSLVTNVPGTFPETLAFVPYAGISQQYFRVQAILNP